MWFDAGIEIAESPSWQFRPDVPSHPAAAQLVADADQAWMKQLEEVISKGVDAGRFR